MFSWMRRKQDLVVLSTSEAKYMATNEVSCEEVWLCNFLLNLFEGPLNLTIICRDNQSCIKLTDNPVFHARKNYINIKSHCI